MSAWQSLTMGLRTGGHGRGLVFWRQPVLFKLFGERTAPHVVDKARAGQLDGNHKSRPAETATPATLTLQGPATWQNSSPCAAHRRT